MIKFGIIGAGILAPLHAQAIARNRKAELVAITDIDAEKASELAKAFNVQKTYTNFEDMLQDETIDAVCICVPSGLHAQIAVKCAEMGKHVLCEKPLDIQFSQMDLMIDACKGAGVKLASVFQRRTLPHLQAAKAAFDRGDLGNLMMIQATLKYYRDDQYYASAGWRGKWELDGGGALMNQGVHGIDLMQWIAGDVESVFAYGGTLARNIEVEDTAVAVLKFKNGGLGTILGATSVFPEQDTTIEINGDKGTVRVSDQKVDMWNLMDGEAEQKTRPELPKANHDGHVIIIDDFIEAILNDHEPMITGLEARKSVEIILAIYESIRTGQEVKLKQFHPYQSYKQSSM